MPPRAELLLPPKALSSCIAAAVLRDIRGTKLSEEDRFNYFPATPLITVTYIIEGELHLCSVGATISEVKAAPPLAKVSVTPPQAAPIVSWGGDDIFAISIAFYPDAWMLLVGNDVTHIPNSMISALKVLGSGGDFDVNWRAFCQHIDPIWRDKRGTVGASDWVGSDRISDWSRSLFNRLSLTSTGQSIRTFERRMRRWTGQSRQQVEFASAMEELHRRRVSAPELPLAELALETGFSDQSHMGRAVRRTTGFSPARLNKMIETEEPFWCYRLLGERF